MSGFRLWKHDFVVGDYTADAAGVKLCLETVCAPLFATANNGCGWEIDTSKCPNSEAILLQPTQTVYALFFKHTSGLKLMIALSLYEMSSGQNTSRIDNSYKYEAGWLPSKIKTGSNTYNYHYNSDLMISMSMGDSWDVTRSIRDEGFYPATSTLISSLSYNNDSSSTSYPLWSLLKSGTSDTSTGSVSYGTITGSACRYFIMADEKGNVIIGGRYRNQITRLCMAGNLYTTKRYDYDTLSTNKLCSRNFGISTYYPLGCYSSTNQSITGNNVDLKYERFIEFKPDGTNTQENHPCASAYNLWKEVESNHRSSLAIYTKYGMIDSDVIRAINNSGCTMGQTYNDNSWCFIHSQEYVYTYFSDDGSHSGEYGFVIHWDGAFNGTNSIA